MLGYSFNNNDRDPHVVDNLILNIHVINSIGKTCLTQMIKQEEFRREHEFESQWNSYHIYDKLISCRKNILMEFKVMKLIMT